MFHICRYTRRSLTTKLILQHFTAIRNAVETDFGSSIQWSVLFFSCAPTSHLPTVFNLKKLPSNCGIVSMRESVPFFGLMAQFSLCQHLSPNDCNLIPQSVLNELCSPQISECIVQSRMDSHGALANPFVSRANLVARLVQLLPVDKLGEIESIASKLDFYDI
jgi:hypothetical protein